MKESKIRFENEQNKPIQIVLKEKDIDNTNDVTEVMEERPLQEEEDNNTLQEEDNNTLQEEDNNTPNPTRQDISPIEKISIVATIVLKAIGKGLVKAFIWITGLFRRREEESERKDEPESV